MELIKDQVVVRKSGKKAPSATIVKKKFAVNVVINLTVYIAAYIIFYLIKKQSFIYDNNYLVFLPVFISAWGLGGLISGKFRIRHNHTKTERLKKYYASLLISIGTAAIFLNIVQFSISRFVVAGSFIAAFLAEIIIELHRTEVTNKEKPKDKFRFSYTYLILDAVILLWIVFFYIVRRFDFAYFDQKHLIMFFGFYLSWAFSAQITHQFKQFDNKSNLWSKLGMHIKFILLFNALLAFIDYILLIENDITLIFASGAIIYSLWSTAFAIFLFINKIPLNTDNIRSEFLQAYELKVPRSKTATVISEYKYKFPGGTNRDVSLPQKLDLIYLKERPEVFSFLERKIDLASFNIDRTYVIRTGDIYNVKVLPDNGIELFINLYKLNGIKRINQYLIEVNKKLAPGGVIAGNFEPIRYRYKRFLRKYPFLLANTLYLFDFIWHRVIPKLPFLQKIYFLISKGKNRAISLAEGFGRLYYCGFEVVDLKVIDNLCYFSAKKIDPPSSDQNPSYSILIKMRRIGKNGKPIYVYKLRTMHPYSEYLQEFVYMQNALETGGKFKNDFRVTKWGRILRRLWLDEMPMLINWFKGECKLVGIRPLSEHYLSLYDEETRERRLKYKPGLIPPFYADLPKTMEEIIISERKYLDAFDKNSFKTDVTYFLKAFNNIVIKGKRSA
jgi:lipopolysaccharide/colanic/teichoic acid biosynthesis glycosyltransferase